MKYAAFRLDGPIFGAVVRDPGGHDVAFCTAFEEAELIAGALTDVLLRQLAAAR